MLCRSFFKRFSKHLKPKQKKSRRTIQSRENTSDDTIIKTPMVNNILPINNDVFDELMEKTQHESTQIEQSFICTDTSTEIREYVHTVSPLKNEIRVLKQRVKSQCARIGTLKDLSKTLCEKCLMGKDCEEYLNQVRGNKLITFSVVSNTEFNAESSTVFKISLSVQTAEI